MNVLGGIEVSVLPLLSFETGPFAIYKWQALFHDWRIFFNGLLFTLGISIGALLLAMILGFFFGMLSTSHWKILRGITRCYVEFIQNTPLLIQIFFVYYGLPLIGVTLEVPMIGVLCVGIYHGAYISEVVRSGINSISIGQTEAAYSQGFNYWQTMGYIILPQAWRIILPPLTNQVVSLLKNTSMVAIISGADIMFVAKSWSSYNLYYGPAFVAAGILYFILCFPLATLARKLEEENKKAY